MIANLLYKSFIKDNFIVFVGHILIYLKGIILIPLIIKTTDVKVYGGFVLLTSILGISFALSSFGAGFRAKRFLPSTEIMSARQELFYPQFYFNLITIVLFSVILLIIRKEINLYFFKDEISYSSLIIPAYLVSYFFYSQGVDYFRYTSRVSYMNVALIFFPFFHILLILIYFYLFKALSVNVLMLSQIISAVFVSIPSFWIVFKEIGLSFKFYDIKALISDIRLGFPLIVNLIFDFIITGSDRYFIALFLTITDVGYYSPAYALGSIILFLPRAIGTVLPQLLSKALDNNSEYTAQRMLNYSIKFYILLAIPFFFGSLAIGDLLLSILANKTVVDIAFGVTPIVAIGTIFYGLNLILSNIFFVVLKTSLILKMNLLSAFFSLLLNSTILYYYKSILVPAFTFLASQIITFLYVNYKIRKIKWSVDYQPYILIKSIFASFVMAAILFLMKFNFESSLWSIVLMLIGISIYICIIFIIKVFSQKELEFLNQFNLFRNTL